MTFNSGNHDDPKHTLKNTFRCELKAGNIDASSIGTMGIYGNPKKIKRKTSIGWTGKIKCYFFAVKWLWSNRHWKGTRQKYKQLDRSYQAYMRKIKEGR